ncbi:DUF3558 domain-containing protein [Lentzea sp. NBRC 105346]|uniref:DUF3558 domain-containing protein n=1 Tax=Lentzea sp. NBRC 105346 TaxID=3032205 RepID=UPI0025554BBC|nr:DUF3558 domain-containing protein [Lentzea sp. NBRC 105346]
MVLLGLAAAGCTGKEPGNATAGETTATTKQGSPASTSGSSGNGTGLASVKPCSLLKSEDATALKLSAPEDLDANSCQWRTTPDRTLVRLNIYPDKALKDFVPGPNSEISDTKVGGHPAKFIKKPVSSSSCAYSIGVTEGSRIDVGASGSTLEAACEAAKSVAEKVEPNLP